MHLSITQALILPVLLVVGPAAADDWTIHYESIAGIGCCSSGTWFNDFGYKWSGINFDEGCRAPGVTNVREFCIDWGNARGHFISDWGEKHCMRLDREEAIREGDYSSTYQTYWKPTSCNW
jgi:hypothetical protein